jgi:hypothetical protein
MSVYSFASIILFFLFFFAGLSMDLAVALFAACGVAEILSFGQRFVTSPKASVVRDRPSASTPSPADSEAASDRHVAIRRAYGARAHSRS